MGETPCGERITKRSPAAARFWQRVRKTDGCWLWTGEVYSAACPYGRINVAGKPLLAHRFSWELVNGAIPAGMLVCHRCDTPLCVRPDHLFLGTHAENMADKARKGKSWRGDRNPSRMHPERCARGDRNGNVSVSDADVGACRFVHAVYGVDGAALARAVGMRSRSAMNAILRGQSRAPTVSI